MPVYSAIHANLPEPVVESRWTSTRFLLAASMTLLVLGYWGFGKSFAYLGVHPVYVGEVMVALTLLLALRYGRLFVVPSGSFAVWGLMLLAGVGQVAFSIYAMKQNPLEVIRNFAVLYYALYAYVAYVLLNRMFDHPSGLTTLMTEWLPSKAPLLLVAATVSLLIGEFYWTAKVLQGNMQPLPIFPGTFVPIFNYKPTDASMPLLLLLGLWFHSYVRNRIGAWVFVLLLFGAARSRSVLLAFLLTLLVFWRPTRQGIAFLLLCAAVFGVFWVADVKIRIGYYRELSARQFTQNLQTLIGGERDKDASGNVTKEWRMRWWSAIWEDAQSSDRILIGRGWGSNPADDFGFQNNEGINALRNPHNVFLGILSRGGWLAALLFAAFHAWLLFDLLRAWSRSPESAELRYTCVLAMLFMVVSLLHSSNDVFLESPQNAIPHWAMVGFCWAVIRASLRQCRDRESNGWWEDSEIVSIPVKTLAPGRY